MKKTTVITIAVALLPYYLFQAKAQAQPEIPVASIKWQGPTQMLHVYVPGRTDELGPDGGKWYDIPQDLKNLSRPALETFGLLHWNLEPNHTVPHWMNDVRERFTSLDPKEQRPIWMTEKLAELAMEKVKLLGATQSPPEKITESEFAQASEKFRDSKAFLTNLGRCLSALGVYDSAQIMSLRFALQESVDNIDNTAKLQFAHISANGISLHRLAPQASSYEGILQLLQTTLVRLGAQAGDRLYVVPSLIAKSPGIQATLGELSAQGVGIAETPDIARYNMYFSAAPTGNRAEASAIHDVVLKAGTIIKLEVRAPVVGTKISEIGYNQPFFKVTHDVTIGKTVVIPAGAEGYGSITHFRAPGRYARNGQMTMLVEMVEAGNGLKLKVRSREISIFTGISKNTPVFKKITNWIAIVSGVLSPLAWATPADYPFKFIPFIKDCVHVLGIALCVGIVVKILALLLGGWWIRGDAAIIPSKTPAIAETVEDSILSIKE